jgi:hypothetical protein
MPLFNLNLDPNPLYSRVYTLVIKLKNSYIIFSLFVFTHNCYYLHVDGNEIPTGLYLD